MLHYFDSAEDVLLAVLRERDGADQLALAFQGSAPTNEAELRELLHEGMAGNAAQREMVRLYTVLTAEPLNRNHPAYEYFRWRQAEARRTLAGLMAWRDDAESLAAEIAAVMDGLQLAWLRDASFDLVSAWDIYAGIRIR